MRNPKRIRTLLMITLMLTMVAAFLVTNGSHAQQQKPASSFTPVIEEPFDVVRARDKGAKPRVMAAAIMNVPASMRSATTRPASASSASASA